VAEREGFEPPVRLPVLRISSATHSTTLPPLREGSRLTARWSLAEYHDGAGAFKAAGLLFSLYGRPARRIALWAAFAP
jgi:hypothetical protein